MCERCEVGEREGVEGEEGEEPDEGEEGDEGEGDEDYFCSGYLRGSGRCHGGRASEVDDVRCDFGRDIE